MHTRSAPRQVTHVSLIFQTVMIWHKYQRLLGEYAPSPRVSGSIQIPRSLYPALRSHTAVPLADSCRATLRLALAS